MYGRMSSFASAGTSLAPVRSCGRWHAEQPSCAQVRSPAEVRPAARRAGTRKRVATVQWRGYGMNRSFAIPTRLENGLSNTPVAFSRRCTRCQSS